MVLVITISLSNGGTLTYELSKEIYSQRAEFVDDEKIPQDWRTLYKFGDSHRHEITVENDEIHHKAMGKMPGDTGVKKTGGYYDYLVKFETDSFKGMESIQEISPNMKFGFFFVRVNELSELYSIKSINPELNIVGDWYIFAFSDLWSKGKPEFIRPVSVKVEWKHSFSNSVKENFKCFDNNSNK